MGGRLRLKKALTVAVLMRWGVVTCGGNQCQDCPTEQSPAFINTVDCLACGGSGETEGRTCADCWGQGKSRLTCCPRKLLTAEAMEVMNLAEMARRGCLPFDGGVMSQPAALMDAIRMVWAMESPHRAKAKLFD